MASTVIRFGIKMNTYVFDECIREKFLSYSNYTCRDE